MLRYLKATRLFWSASIAAEMEYRFNFAMACLGSVLTLTGGLLTLGLFYRTGYQMGDWTWEQALIVVGLYTMLDGVQATFLMPNRMLLSMFVRQGTLDFVLIKPIDAQFWMTVRKISIFGMPNIFIGLALVIYAGTRHDPTLHWHHYLLGVVPIAMGLIILYSLGYILATFCIWTVKLDNLNHALQALLETGRYPIPAYAPVYQIIFTFVIPVAFMTTVPAKVMLDQPQAWLWMAAGAGVALLLFGLARWFWHFALRSYTSASS